MPQDWINLYITQNIILNNHNLCVLANHLAVRCTVSTSDHQELFLHTIWQVKAIASAVGMYGHGGRCLWSHEELGSTCTFEAAKMGQIYKHMSLWDWWSWWSLSAASGTPRNNDHPQRFPDKSMLTRQRESSLIVCTCYEESKIWLPVRR